MWRCNLNSEVKLSFWVVFFKSREKMLRENKPWPQLWINSRFWIVQVKGYMQRAEELKSLLKPPACANESGDSQDFGKFKKKLVWKCSGKPTSNSENWHVIPSVPAVLPQKLTPNLVTFTPLSCFVIIGVNLAFFPKYKCQAFHWILKTHPVGARWFWTLHDTGLFCLTC